MPAIAYTKRTTMKGCSNHMTYTRSYAPLRQNGKNYAQLLHRAVEVTTPANRLMIVLHAAGANDGGKPVLDHLMRKNHVIGREGKPVGQPQVMVRSSVGERFLIEAPYPMTALDMMQACDIPPQYATHVLMILPGAQGIYDLYAGDQAFNGMIYQNAPTAFALGDVSKFDPVSRGVTFYDDLGEKTRRLLSYVESKYERPVMFIATGPTTIVDREITCRVNVK